MLRCRIGSVNFLLEQKKLHVTTHRMNTRLLQAPLKPWSATLCVTKFQVASWSAKPGLGPNILQ